MTEPSGPDEAPNDNTSTSLDIYSWNVNGIDPLLQRQSKVTSFFKPDVPGGSGGNPSGPKLNLRDVLQKYAWPIFFLLQEVKIRPNDEATKRALEKAVVRADDEPFDHPSYKAFLCLPKDPFNARGFGRKVYGVCTLIRDDFYDDFVETIREVQWDSEGRFLVCETNDNFGSLPKLAVINIYGVNGTDAAYRDGTGKVVGTRHDRKLQVHAALQEECRQLESKGIHVILAGDINIARSQLDGHPNLRTQPEQHCLNRADFERRFFGNAEDDPVVANGAQQEDVESESSLRMIDTFVSTMLRPCLERKMRLEA